MPNLPLKVCILSALSWNSFKPTSNLDWGIWTDIIKSFASCFIIESVISKKTKAILPVHLTGRIAEMDKIKKIARKYNLYILYYSLNFKLNSK